MVFNIFIILGVSRAILVMQHAKQGAKQCAEQRAKQRAEQRAKQCAEYRANTS
jgi:hypothetical protein